MFDYRFREVHRFSVAHGNVTGFSTMEQGLRDSRYLEFHAVSIPTSCGSYRIVSAAQLGSPSLQNIESMFRASHRYAVSKNYVTGLPAFEQGLDQSHNLVFGVTLLNSSATEVRTVPASVLGTPAFDDTGSMFRAVHRYARDLNQGFVSGFPLFEKGLQNGVLHYGIALVKPSVSLAHVPADVLAVYGGTGLRLNDLSGIIIFNNSDTHVYARVENSVEVYRVEPHSYVVGRFEGIASWNQSNGKVAKAPDWNIGYIDNTGLVRAFGPKSNFPYAGMEPIWLSAAPDAGWNKLFSAAAEFTTPQPSNNQNAGNHDHIRDWDGRGGVITDAPTRDRELASRTA